MSFGCSVGDFLALGQLAWKIYKTCKDAPQGFKNVSQEVLSLHAVLKEVEEMYSDTTMSAAQQSRLRIVGDGCCGVLEDLQGILDRYNRLGTKTKRTWDRLAWGTEDIAELRSRLISNTVLLTTFVNTSQVAVGKKLDILLQEFRDGQHEGSLISTQTVDSLSTDERQAWRAIRKELEDVGVSVTAFDANRDFIVNWFRTAIGTGAFEERTVEDRSNSLLGEDDSRQSLEDSGHDSILSKLWGDEEHDASLKSTSAELQALKLSSEADIRVTAMAVRFSSYNEDLFKAVQSGNEISVRQLLKQGADINAKDDRDRSTPLHRAVSSNSEVMVKLLLKKGADINVKDNFGYTALHRASRSGHELVVLLLLEHRAKTNEKDCHGYTALHLGAASGHTTVIQLLLKYEAEINAKSHNGHTALHGAVVYGHESVVQLLLNSGAKVDEKDNDECTALHLGAVYGHETVVQMLLENGANIHTKSDSKTALHIAAGNGHEAVVQLLLKNGAKINCKDKDLCTARHLAAFHGHETVVQLLLKNETKINQKER